MADLTSKLDIEEWLERHHIKTITVDDNGRVNVLQSVQLFGYDPVFGTPLRFPFRFGYIKGDFVAAGVGLETLASGPTYVSGNMNINSNEELCSLAFAPEYIGGSLHLERTGMKGLHNIHKYIKHIGISLILDEMIESHLLGVMLIKGLTNGIIISLNVRQRNPRLGRATEIINRHITIERDMLKCQDELIESGLHEYAKL